MDDTQRLPENTAAPADSVLVRSSEAIALDTIADAKTGRRIVITHPEVRFDDLKAVSRESLSVTRRSEDPGALNLAYNKVLALSRYDNTGNQLSYDTRYGSRHELFRATPDVIDGAPAMVIVHRSGVGVRGDAGVAPDKALENYELGKWIAIAAYEASGYCNAAKTPSGTRVDGFTVRAFLDARDNRATAEVLRGATDIAKSHGFGLVKVEDMDTNLQLRLEGVPIVPPKPSETVPEPRPLRTDVQTPSSDHGNSVFRGLFPRLRK